MYVYKILKQLGKMYTTLSAEANESSKEGFLSADVIRKGSKEDHWYYRSARFSVLGRSLETYKLTLMVSSHIMLLCSESYCWNLVLYHLSGDTGFIPFINEDCCVCIG